MKSCFFFFQGFLTQDSLFQAVTGGGGKLRSAPQRVLINITQPPEG